MMKTSVRLASGNGQNIFDKMEFFMEAGCLCDSRYLPVGHGVL